MKWPRKALQEGELLWMSGRTQSEECPIGLTDFRERKNTVWMEFGILR